MFFCVQELRGSWLSRFSPHRSNMSCTARWAPLSSCVRSVQRMTRMWRLSPVVISCAPPVSLHGRYDSGCEGLSVGVQLKREVPISSQYYSTSAPVISMCCYICLFCLWCRSQRVREQDVPSVAVRLRVQSPLSWILLTLRTTVGAPAGPHLGPREFHRPATTMMMTTDLKTPTSWWANLPVQR